jgi:hypothetical protein
MFRKNKVLKPGSPASIPDYISKAIVQEIRKITEPSDHWVSYKAVISPRKDAEDIFDIRVFDEFIRNKKGVEVKDYSSLDAYPDLIEFEGWINQTTKQVNIRTVKKLGTL